MSDSAEVELLRQLIVDDERTVKALQAAEAEVEVDLNAPGFRAATDRANVLSTTRAAEDRLRKNRERLAELKHGS